MKLIKILIILYTTLSLGCNNNTLLKEDITTIDMDQYETVDFDSLVESVLPIKLQKESSVLLVNCKKIIQNKNYYYLLVNNRTGYEVQIYDNSGKFIKQITSEEEEFPIISTIHISPNKKELWVLFLHNTLCKYTLDGSFIEKITLPFSCVGMISLDKQEFLIYDGRFNKDWEHEFALTNLIEVEKFFLRKNRKLLQSFDDNVFAANLDDGNEIFIFPNMKDTIYMYDSKEKMMEPYFHLDFHGDYLTEEMLPRDRYFSDKEMHDIITEKKYIYSKNNFYQATDKLFFKLLGKRNNSHFIDLQDNSLKSYDSLFDDYSTSNSFLGTNGNNLFMLVKKKSLAEHYKNKFSSYPSIQNEISTKTDKDDSWILLNIKLKN